MSKPTISLTIAVLLLAACGTSKMDTKMNTTSTGQALDWQGHRGARGLAPENTIPSFLKALEYPEVMTLELDVVVSADQQVVVSHEPWMSHHICTFPDGRLVTPAAEQALNLYEMSYETISAFDCGSRGHSLFPEQVAMAASKPTLAEVIAAVDAYCQERQRALPSFNIELKSKPEWYNKMVPAPRAFARIVIDLIRDKELTGRCNIQSFDPQILKESRAYAPEIALALLVENTASMEDNIANLGFVPYAYSPHYRLVDGTLAARSRAMGMRLIPWTVNDLEEMQRLLKLGVDGIITDYPDRIPR